MANHKCDPVMAAVSRYMPGIICWGDSLTAGAWGNGVTYPMVLQSMIQQCVTSIPVVNMGVGGESTVTILGRNGAIPYIVSEPLTIPADTTPVEIHFTSKEGQHAAPLRQGHAGVNPVTIGGIEGTLSITQENHTCKEFTYHFTRSATAEAASIPTGTQIVTAASSQYLDYITVIFIGQNGGYTDPADLIRQQRAIIDHQTANQERFVIVGLHTGTEESRKALETAMEAEYGAQYINLRRYMATQAMADAGLEPTPEDRVLMTQGSTPYCFMVKDHCHFNSLGYELIGKLIFKKMDELGYFNEVKAAIVNSTK